MTDAKPHAQAWGRRGPLNRLRIGQNPRVMAEPVIHLGTSAFTAAGWPGSFYPESLRPADYLSYYATQFDTVEVDSTFYRTPSESTVRGWNAKTPPGFVFAAKVPQAITHEKVLVDCEADLAQFLRTMDLLGEKLGPLLFQFGYFNRGAFRSLAEFLTRLEPFLKRLPSGYRFALEVRNKSWVDARLADVLRSRNVALALVDHVWMPRRAEVFEKLDPVTADFAYIRWLGDRKGIEKETKTWNKTIVDRSAELGEWVEVCNKIAGRGVPIFAFANNHYAGNGPATVREFEALWNAQRPPKAKAKRAENLRLF
jgi:uncharacterized protein YecE (DUF72 family)